MEAGEEMINLIINGDHDQLIRARKMGRTFKPAIPTPEHYLPCSMPRRYRIKMISKPSSTISLLKDQFR